MYNYAKRLTMFFSFTVTSGGIKGAFAPPVRGSAPTCPPSEEKNGQNKLFSANFWIFAPLRIAFCPLDAPPKFLVPPLTVTKRQPIFFVQLITLTRENDPNYITLTQRRSAPTPSTDFLYEYTPDRGGGSKVLKK